jgi:hypothetical protein
MTIQKSIVMMTNTGNQYDVVSDKFRSDGYWGNSDGLHTISVHFQHLVGNFHVQGTLSIDPQEGDWFDIGINPTDNRILHVEYDGTTGVNGFSFIGNFTYLRVKLSRTERLDIAPDNAGRAFPEQGQINKVLLVI